MPNSVAKRSSDIYVANTVKGFHKQLKASLMLKDDMPDMVSAAPAALYMMGELYELAFSDYATTSRLTGTSSENDLMKYVSPTPLTETRTDLERSDKLPSCLVALVRQGLNAFDGAHKNMKTLHILTPQLIGPTGTMSTIVKLLENPKDAKKHLSREMQLLRDDLQKCVNAVNNIEKEFSTWTKMADELRVKATEETNRFDGLNRGRSDSAGNDMSQTQLWLGVVEERKKSSAEQLKELKKRVIDATAQYNLALNHAGAWRDLKFAAVAEVANTTFGIINTAVDIAQQAPGVLSDAFRAIENTSPLAISGDKDGSNNKRSPAPQAAISPEAVKPSETVQQPVDTGLQRANEVQAHVATLRGCLRNVTMEELLRAVRVEDGIFQKTLQDIRQFEQDISLPGSQPRTEAQSIIKRCLDLGKEIRERADNSVKPGYRAPQGDSLAVDRWVSRLDGLAERALKLKARAGAQPGRAFGADVPILSHIKDTYQSDRNKPFDTAALLERRWQQMEIMKAVMEAERTRYDARTDRLGEVEESLRELHSQLETLRTSKETMERVGDVLAKAIQYVGMLHAEIRRLANYFNTIAQIVTHIGTAQTERYLRLLEDKFKDDANGKGLRLASLPATILGIPLSDWEAQEIFSALLTLRGYFAVVYENADFYDRVSSQHLLPSIRTVSRLSITASIEVQQAELEELKTSTDHAAKAIRKEGEKRQQQIRQFIDDSIEAIAKETGSLPVIKSTFHRKKLIEEGVKNAGIEDDASACWNEDDEEDPNALGES